MRASQSIDYARTLDPLPLPFCLLRGESLTTLSCLPCARHFTRNGNDHNMPISNSFWSFLFCLICTLYMVTEQDGQNLSSSRMTYMHTYIMLVLVLALDQGKFKTRHNKTQQDKTRQGLVTRKFNQRLIWKYEALR
jgi:hypothetical protein